MGTAARVVYRVAASGFGAAWHRRALQQLQQGAASGASHCHGRYGHRRIAVVCSHLQRAATLRASVELAAVLSVDHDERRGACCLRMSGFVNKGAVAT